MVEVLLRRASGIESSQGSTRARECLLHEKRYSQNMLYLTHCAALDVSQKPRFIRLKYSSWCFILSVPGKVFPYLSYNKKYLHHQVFVYMGVHTRENLYIYLPTNFVLPYGTPFIIFHQTHQPRPLRLNLKSTPLESYHMGTGKADQKLRCDSSRSSRSRWPLIAPLQYLSVLAWGKTAVVTAAEFTRGV